MTTGEMENIIVNAINNYRIAKLFDETEKIKDALSEMENVYIMVCNRNVPGTELLRKTILKEREAV